MWQRMAGSCGWSAGNNTEWPQIGLPRDYYALIAPYGACFMPEGKEAVGHGGIALEEVMVPFVRIAGAR